MIISELEKRIQDSLKSGKKSRVVLTDYDVEKDIEGRIALSKLNQDEYAILEEILYSSLTISLTRLAENVDLDIDVVKDFVESFSKTALFTFDGEKLFVDKEKRKYFEAQIERFEEDFEPGMEYLQSLLKNVPIHLLPIWYQIPRSSNNIFDSLVEKYLETPKMYARYVTEFMEEESIVKDVLNELDAKNDYRLYVNQFCKDHGYTKEQVTEAIITGEFNFLFSSVLEPHLEGWVEIITPFAEWRDYMLKKEKASTKSIDAHFEIALRRHHEYAFIEDMTSVLKACEKLDFETMFDSDSDAFVLEDESLAEHLDGSHLDKSYLDRLVNKLMVIGLAVIDESYLRPTPHANEWIQMQIEKRAHVTFKHPHNYLDIQKISPLSTERSILEIQKSMAHVAKLGWVHFNDFLRTTPIELSDEHKIVLKKQGRNWAYALPNYSEDEKELIRYTVMEWFFESGIVQCGVCDGKPCFKLTHLGRSIFT